MDSLSLHPGVRQLFWTHFVNMVINIDNLQDDKRASVHAALALLRIF